MQTLTIKCDNAILPHLTKILKSINGVDIDTKTKKSKKRDLKSAVERLLEVLKKAPNNYFALYDLATILTRTKNFTEALKLAQKAATIKPTVAKTYNLIGVIFASQNHPLQSHFLYQ